MCSYLAYPFSWPSISPADNSQSLSYIIYVYIYFQYSTAELENTLNDMVGNMKINPVIDALTTGVLPSYNGKEDDLDKELREKNGDMKQLRVLDGAELIEESEKRQISLKELIQEKRMKEYKFKKLGNNFKGTKKNKKKSTKKTPKSVPEL
jgi:hypothetical protein